MPNWTDVLKAIGDRQRDGAQAVDLIRRQYLEQLHAYTGRNVIAYYSGWLSRPQQIPNFTVGDEDKNAFMSAIHQLDRARGLDLMLHTPGGNTAATESLVDYLHQMFGKDLRVIVPQLAMSAGTMIACAAKSIVMGKQSNLGPIDPQLNGVAAQGVLDEFDLAIKNITHTPASAPLWQAIVGKYHPTFLLECKQAIDWSKDMVSKWLRDVMFANEADPKAKADSVVAQLSDHALTKTHSRHLSKQHCEQIGLRIESLEDDPKLQDLVLTVHHAYMHTFAQTPSVKIVENHRGAAVVLQIQAVLMQGPPGPSTLMSNEQGMPSDMIRLGRSED